MSKFQIIVLGLFVFFAAGGLIFFSAFKSNSSSQEVHLTMWGTFSGTVMHDYIEALLKQEDNKNLTITYFQAAPANIYQSYIEALATGAGPDLLLISHDLYWQFSNKLVTIPYSVMSQDAFRSSYIQADQAYMLPSGLSAIPFAVDPLVLFWNRDIFTNSLIPRAPQYWDEIVATAPRLTAKDAALNITTSAVGLGEYYNITHAKDILSLLMLQTGNPIVTPDVEGYRGTLDTSAQALSFYTQFADPLKQAYSWNRALPDSKSLFISNKLGMYFGYTSEFYDISQKNPNLNFDVALMPQIRPKAGTRSLQMTYGNLYGVSVARSSQNPAAAAAAAVLLGSHDASVLWNKTTAIPSDRNDALGLDASDARSSLFSRSALQSVTWPDPNSGQTDYIFGTMIDSITSGRASISQASKDGNDQLNSLLGK